MSIKIIQKDTDQTMKNKHQCLNTHIHDNLSNVIKRKYVSE